MISLFDRFVFSTIIETLIAHDLNCFNYVTRNSHTLLFCFVLILSSLTLSITLKRQNEKLTVYMAVISAKNNLDCVSTG